jgi:hypothetical protein
MFQDPAIAGWARRLAGVACVIALGGALAPAALAATAAGPALPGGCEAKPEWIESATLPTAATDPLRSCFADPGQAEATVSILNNRPYAQLITVRGMALDLAKSSFGSALAGQAARLLAQASSGHSVSAFLLGPGDEAKLAVDRPPPGAGREIHIDPAPDNAFAVGAQAWALLSAAGKRLSLPAGTAGCILTAVYATLSGPPHPARALARIRACIDAAGLPAHLQALLLHLAARPLSDAFFQSVIERQGSEPHPARLALWIPPSIPGPIDSAISLGPANFNVPGEEKTVEHLTASGGSPPYRFYVVPEPDQAGVPYWFQLAADGTLILEPPAEFAPFDFFIEVVDSNGERSYVPYG